jgi:hypothetical protein
MEMFPYLVVLATNYFGQLIHGQRSKIYLGLFKVD